MSRQLRRVLAVCLTLVVGLAACGTSNSTLSGDPTDSTSSTGVAPGTATDDEELRAVLAEFVGTSPGGVDVLVTQDGATRRLAVGIGSSHREALVPGRPFRVGSISKPFVATMILQLVDEGTVDLDARLGDYLPDTPVGADATIRELLAHQSGIANYTDQQIFRTDVLSNLSHRFSPADILHSVQESPPGPAGEYAYSNTNYILLGQVIEHLDGTALNTSLQTRITGPLGLEGTFFDTGDSPLPAGLVGGWSDDVADGDPAAEYTSIASSAWSAGALVSTTDDLAAFLGALADQRLTSAVSLAAMTNFGPGGAGLGVFQVGLGSSQLDFFPSSAPLGFGHSGGIPGFTAFMAIDPSSGATIVILTNNDALIAELLAPEVLAVS